MEATTQVLVDDADIFIQYGPGWVSKTSSGPPSADSTYTMYGTLHETVTQSELSYTFIGSHVEFCFQSTDSNSSFWSFTIDNIPGGNLQSELVRIGSQGIVKNCYETNGALPDGQHEFRIIINASQGQPFSFDYLFYTPSPTVNLSSTDLILTPDSPLFEYGGDWINSTNVNTHWMETTTVNSTFTFEFYGSSIFWFGFLNTSFPKHNYSTVAAFSIDGGEASLITLEDHVPTDLASSTLDGTILAESLLFQSFSYPRGQHRLDVTLLGGVTSEIPLIYSPGMPIPLTLSSLVIQNGTTIPSLLPAPPALPSKSPVPTVTPNTTKGGSRSTANLAVILGCSLGGAAILGLLIIGILCARRKTRRGSFGVVNSGRSRSVEPFQDAPALTPVSPYQKGEQRSQTQGQFEDEPTEVDAPPSYITGPHN
ncbi:hypothetical protein GALMADRAFT_144632 [Galerina marginata CBS 339.88]|uniref:Transmembrane protein n=1 Tax=Galerina marginata (strain CBS 339.88) TaxID=685588 RepID=A0A067SU65_GALM3|nr:hypothetical protein GALMADRAFT_144632 [Galerina marginata CBS 339.88]